MTLLEHLDELRSRLVRCAVAFSIALAVCWALSGPILRFLLRPIRRHLVQGGEIVFIHLTEPFVTYLKAAGLAALFLTAPYVLYQFWAFVAPGLYRHERRLVVPFVVFGSLSFVAGGVFGYAVATPIAAGWLLGLGGDYHAALTLRSAFQFETRVILGMGLTFELPVVIFFLSWIGLVTPAFLMRHFRTAVLIIAIVAAVVTPTGDMLTMAVFVAPMVVLYLLGVAVSWVVGRRAIRKEAECSTG
jgi:sec-independent protein translocase protein TatC